TFSCSLLAVDFARRSPFPTTRMQVIASNRIGFEPKVTLAHFGGQPRLLLYGCFFAIFHGGRKGYAGRSAPSAYTGLRHARSRIRYDGPRAWLCAALARFS